MGHSEVDNGDMGVRIGHEVQENINQVCCWGAVVHCSHHCPIFN